jgi:hypothetical protein
MQQRARHPALEYLDALVGEWETEATHQFYPGTVVRGRSTFEWLEGGYFLIQRSRNEHPDFPDSIAIFGCDDAGGGCSMHYFDSRGVSRVYGVDAGEGVWRFWRDWPGFSQRFTGTFSEDGDTVTGNVELSTDGATWEWDLQISYRRVK